MNNKLNLPNPQDGEAFLCADTFDRVSMALIYTCQRGQPKIWSAFPRQREKELRNFSCTKTILLLKETQQQLNNHFSFHFNCLHIGAELFLFLSTKQTCSCSS